MAVGGMLCSSLSLLAFRVCAVDRSHYFLTEVFPSVSLLSFNVLYMKPFSQQDGILWPESQGRSDVQTAATVSGCSDRMHCFPLSIFWTFCAVYSSCHFFTGVFLHSVFSILIFYI